MCDAGRTRPTTQAVIDRQVARCLGDLDKERLTGRVKDRITKAIHWTAIDVDRIHNRRGRDGYDTHS